MAGCSTKVFAQQARVVVSKVEEPVEEEEKRSEEKIRFLVLLMKRLSIVQQNKTTIQDII